MKFEELYSVLTEQETRQSLVEKMKNKGWEYSGNGEYGTVLSRPDKNYVLKIYNDYAYDQYLEFIKEHSDNPHVVKISGILEYGKGLKMVSIEKLNPIKDSKWREKIATGYADFLDRGKTDADNFYNTLEKFEEWFTESMLKDMEYYKKNPYFQQHVLINKKANRRLKFFIENHLPLFKIIYELDKFRDTDTTLDLHLGNFMIRPSTNEIVVTDPLVE